MKPFLRSAYNHDPSDFSKATATVNSLPTRTVQADSMETDINVLMRRTALNGGMVPGIQVPPSIQAFEEVFDFQSAMNTIRAATEAFASLPAGLRSRFNNDPRLYVDFVSNADNMDEMIKLGLAKKIEPPKAPEPVSVRVVADPPPATK